MRKRVVRISQRQRFHIPPEYKVVDTGHISPGVQVILPITRSAVRVAIFLRVNVALL